VDYHVVNWVLLQIAQRVHKLWPIRGSGDFATVDKLCLYACLHRICLTHASRALSGDRVAFGLATHFGLFSRRNHQAYESPRLIIRSVNHPRVGTLVLLYASCLAWDHSPCFHVTCSSGRPTRPRHLQG
jgi:hypothetical protein